MAANCGHQISLRGLIQGQAGNIAANLKGCRGGVVEILGFAFDRDHLPATAQADLLRSDGNPRQTPAVEPSVPFLPLALRGENPAV